MNLLELSQKRFSVRKFTAEQISEEDLKYILEVTRMAPSAVNKQPWKFGGNGYINISVWLTIFRAYPTAFHSLHTNDVKRC